MGKQRLERRACTVECLLQDVGGHRPFGAENAWRVKHTSDTALHLTEKRGAISVFRRVTRNSMHTHGKVIESAFQCEISKLYRHRARLVSMFEKSLHLVSFANYSADRQ